MAENTLKTFNRMHIDVNGEIQSKVTAVSKDTARYLDVSLYNNGVALDLTGSQVELHPENYWQSGGNVMAEITDAKSGRCQFKLTDKMLGRTGKLKLQIIIRNGLDVLSTHVFTLYVLESIRNDSDMESTNEYGVLTVLFQEIQDSLDLMKAMVESFGEPGAKAAEFGAGSFWEMMEILAERADTRDIIKANVNSTMDTAKFKSIDKMIESLTTITASLLGGEKTYSSPGNYTWTVPDGVRRIIVDATGAGGSGGSGVSYLNYTHEAAGGGGGGGAAIKGREFIVEPGTAISITIGKGGTSVTAAADRNSVNGENGGATVIGDFITLPGGEGGKGGGDASYATTGKGGAAGGEGGEAGMDSTNAAIGGDGGATLLAAGGRGKTSTTAVTAGTKGSGGGGGIKNDAASGAGGDGYVKIIWGAMA